MFLELEGGEGESRYADVVGAGKLAEVERGDDAREDGVGELAVVKEIREA